MKSQALKDVVIGLYENLLRDFLYIDPTIQEELRRIRHTLFQFERRGLGLFTITFPDVAKFLERGLRDERLSSTRPALCAARSKTDQRPGLLHAFWALIFDEDGMLLPIPNTDAIAGLRQLLLFAKKLNLECSEEKTNAALAEFVEVDESLPRSHPDTWDSDYPQWQSRTGHPLWGPLEVGRESQPELDLDQALPEPSPIRWERFRLLCGMVVSSFTQHGDGRISFDDLRPKHGPGAVADGEVRKHSLSHWPLKLARMFPPDHFASHDLIDRTKTVKEYPSKVLCVPKTQKGPRIIAAEPTAHQWCQGAVERWLRDAIDRSLIAEAIDLRDQSFSQSYALWASKQGHAATVDLSAASDRLSTRLVEYVFHANRDLLDLLHACRTRMFRMPDGSLHVARKFACMGSACTFPVQTIVFTIISIFALLEEEGSRIDSSSIREASGRIQVFGDDIIVPVHAYVRLVKLLTELGLKVNADKSHGTGMFREACGLDAYSGVDVTPAYFLQAYNPRNPESLVSIVASSNNFHEKGCWNAAMFLLNTVDVRVRKRIRMARRDVSQPCIFSYVPSENHLAVRFDPQEQTLKVKALVVDLKIDRDCNDWAANLLQFFSERGSKPLYWEVLEGKGPTRALGQGKRPKARLSLRWVLLEDREV